MLRSFASRLRIKPASLPRHVVTFPGLSERNIGKNHMEHYVNLNIMLCRCTIGSRMLMKVLFETDAASSWHMPAGAKGDGKIRPGSGGNRTRAGAYK